MPVHVIACGALAGELRAVFAASEFDGVTVHYLPANLHNRPEQIVPAIRRAAGDLAPDVEWFVGYADCGTGGALDRFLAEHPGVRRLPGAHCYEFLAGSPTFAALHDAQPGTFYLTDFLAKHFDALVWQGLGLDRHPQLRDTYFANYTRVVFLGQSDDHSVAAAAADAAHRLGLAFEHHHTGRHHLAQALVAAVGAPRRAER